MPQDKINEFIQEILNQSNNKKINLTYTYNDKKHQDDGGECGIYCLHFITYMKNNGDFKKYISQVKNHNYMKKFRTYFYDKEN